IKQIILPGLYSLPVIFESGQNTLMIVACALGVLLLILLAIIIYVVRRARLKKTSDKPIPQKPQSVPVPTSQPAPEPAAGTIQAVTAVPQPTPVPTSVAIQQPVEAIDQSVAPSQAPSGVSDEEINEWLQQGMILVRDGDNAGGEKMFRKVAQARTDEPKAWLWLGYILAQKQEWRAAERCFKLAQKYGHPNAEKALIWLQDQVT
ncbi:MAG: hypothetical protein U9R58_01485, partial [Chloroflexota bacterium]|nr:hypothetical protein [Chloroflexota bacterium]